MSILLVQLIKYSAITQERTRVDVRMLSGKFNNLQPAWLRETLKTSDNCHFNFRYIFVNIEFIE